MIRRALAFLLFVTVGAAQSIPYGYTGHTSGGTGTLSVIQVKFFDSSGNGTGGSSCTSGTTTCAVTTASTTAGNAVVYWAVVSGQTSLSSVSGETTSLCAGCAVSDSTDNVTLSVRYSTSITGGTTSTTCTIAAAGGYIGCGMAEIKLTGTGGISFDTSGTTGRLVTCSTCTGPTLTPTGINDILLHIAVFHNFPPNSGVTGTGYVQGLDGSVSFTSEAHHLNTTSGAAPSWTASSASDAFISAIALTGGNGSGGGTISLLSHTSAASSAGAAVTTSAINTTGASLIVVAIAAAIGGATVSDSSSNTWTTRTLYQDANSSIQLAYCTSCTTSSSHTFTASANFAGIAVAAFSGTTTGFDVEAGNSTASGSTTVTPGSIRPTNSNEALITALQSDQDAAGGDTVDSSFTKIENQAWSNGNNFGIGLAWLFQGSPNTINLTWTMGDSGSCCGHSTVAAFQ